jgi:AbrB family looped-hinge helix DNA binding protein
MSSKGQTTIPKSVRRALGINEGDQIVFRVDETGVTLRRAEEMRNDPAIASFLSFLSKDIQLHPEKLLGFPRASPLAFRASPLVLNLTLTQNSAATLGSKGPSTDALDTSLP